MGWRWASQGHGVGRGPGCRRWLQSVGEVCSPRVSVQLQGALWVGVASLPAAHR